LTKSSRPRLDLGSFPIRDAAKSKTGGPQALSVTRDGPLSIHIQLLDQLRFHIESGTWPPGSLLPAAHHLAGSLGINYNTVRAAYRELERSGYLVSEQGRGTFVAADAPHPRDDQEGVRERLDEALLHAQALNLGPDEFARIAYLRARMFFSDSTAVRVLFAECNAAEVEFHAAEIARGTRIRPESFVLQELKGRGSAFFDGFDILATTLFHVLELQKIVGPKRRVLALMVEPSFSEVVARLIPLPPRTLVAVVASTAVNARKMVNALLGTGLDHLRLWPVALTDVAELNAAFRKADEIYVSRWVLRLHSGEWPTRRNVHEYMDVLDSTALRLLRHAIAEAAEGGTKRKRARATHR